MKFYPMSVLTLLEEKDYRGLLDLVIEKIPTILAAVAIVVFGFWISNLIGKLVVKGLRAKGVDPSIHGFVKTILTLLLKFAFILSAMSTLGVNINSFIAAIGAAGVTAGLGLQNSVSQFASGITILMNKPFKSGDYIELENVNGKVLEIKMMYTVLITVDNKRVIVPNSHITSSNLINYNAENRRRLDLIYSISYNEDFTRAKQVIAKVVDRCDLILKDPAPIIAVKEHAASSINIVCLAWCDSSDYWDAFYYMQEQVKLAFDSEKISIPFNQLDIHINNN